MQLATTVRKHTPTRTSPRKQAERTMLFEVAGSHQQRQQHNGGEVQMPPAAGAACRCREFRCGSFASCRLPLSLEGQHGCCTCDVHGSSTSDSSVAAAAAEGSGGRASWHSPPKLSYVNNRSPTFNKGCAAGEASSGFAAWPATVAGARGRTTNEPWFDSTRIARWSPAFGLVGDGGRT